MLIKRKRREQSYLYTPRVAPYTIAVFPLLANKEKLIKQAKEIFNNLKNCFDVAWDARGNIGKRYYAQDEAGTPCCITVDFQTLDDKTVTLRDRDSMKQIRVKIIDLKDVIQMILEGEEFSKIGKPVG